MGLTRSLVEKMQLQGISERRCCRALGVWRTSIRYEEKPEDPVNDLIRQEMLGIASRNRRYGTPRMTAVLRRDGHHVNHKRVERVYREAGLTLPRKRKRRRRGPRAEARPCPATRRNEVWSCDFIFDRTEYGQKLKILSIVDEYTRECLELRVEKRMNGISVLETLDELMTERGKPAYLRSDNGPEFVSKKLRKWLGDMSVQSVFIVPGSPWENGFVESFHGKFRDECLDEEIFWSRGEAQVVVDWWRRVYNQERPHSALGYQSPAEYAKNAELLGVREMGL